VTTLGFSIYIYIYNSVGIYYINFISHTLSALQDCESWSVHAWYTFYQKICL